MDKNITSAALASLLPLACSQSPGDLGDLSAGDTDGAGSTLSGGSAVETSTTAVTSGENSTSGEESTSTDNGPKLDLSVPDAMPPGPLELTCDNLDLGDPTSVGCEFWTVATPLFNRPVTSYGVGVGNPTDNEVTVTFEDLHGPGNTLRELGQFTIDPQASITVNINGADSLLGIEFESPMVGVNPGYAVRMVSTAPTTVMAITPVGGAPSVMPDASLLLPTNALGRNHIAIGYPGEGNWAIAVATEDGTTVTTPDGDYLLDAFDTVRIALDVDGTGYGIGSDRPIAVFSGTLGSQIPSGMHFADHLEEQLLPLEAWGREYVAARHPVRPVGENPLGPEIVHWRLIAGAANTTIAIDPPQPGVGNLVTLDTLGDFVEIVSAESFLATSDQNFMVMQYMASCEVTDPDGENGGYCGGDMLLSDHDPLTGTGDPYMLQMIPTEQWLDETPFVTDVSYRHDFVTITRRNGTEVELGCLGVLDDERFLQVGNTAFEVGHVFLDLDGEGGEGNCVDGQQYIRASEPISIFVGGYDRAASYAYPGGLSVRTLWDPPDPAG
ncbi:MAG: IgGFc-binding protein [Nannocystaceae bacterium]|nr:IgGFc-binding protein [Nannocystaceae bacterium]